MDHPASEQLRTALATFAELAHTERVLVASDFDGVLAPIVLDPAAARPQPGTIDSLRGIATSEGVIVALVSGRDLTTLRHLTGLENDHDIVLIGSHGAESSHSLGTGAEQHGDTLTPAQRQALESARSALDDVVAQVPSARIEQKPAGVVLHTRGLGEEEAERATELALRTAAGLPGVHAMRGKSVVELTVLEVSKGAALTALAETQGTRATAYFGDDVTDETAFAVLPVENGNVTVKVGEGETVAGYRIPACTDMPGVLSSLATLLADRADASPSA